MIQLMIILFPKYYFCSLFCSATVEWQNLNCILKNETPKFHKIKIDTIFSLAYSNYHCHTYALKETFSLAKKLAHLIQNSKLLHAARLNLCGVLQTASKQPSEHTARLGMHMLAAWQPAERALGDRASSLVSGFHLAHLP